LMVNWICADPTDDESCEEGDAGGIGPSPQTRQPILSPRHWICADTPQSLSPSALLGIARPDWFSPREVTRGQPRSLGTALNTAEHDVELQAIMHAEDELDMQCADDEPEDSIESGSEAEVDESDSDDDDDDDDGDEGGVSVLAPPTPASSSTASTSSRASTKLAVSRKAHLDDLQKTALSSKACNCKLAQAQGHRSCLDRFAKAQLSEIYAEAHGPQAAQWSKSQVLQGLHSKIWALKKPLQNGPDALGRNYKVPLWTLQGQTVCQSAWMSAHNYTRNAMRTHLAFVLRGEGPAAEGGRRLAAKAMLQWKRMQAGKKSWATQWWVMHLELHDFLPNEGKIQIRGAPWKVVFEQQFTPMAKQVGMNCCRTLWMQGRPGALRLLAQKYYPDRPDTELKIGRAADHSRFAECTNCSTLRKRCREPAHLTPNPNPPPPPPPPPPLLPL
jgi:hypothetical protein